MPARDPERDRDAPYELVDPRRRLEYRDREDFDRIAFALRALRRLNPRRMTIALYPGATSLHVQSGVDHRKGSRWAIVGIPPFASREHIAYALVELAGAASVPYAVQALLAGDTGVDA